MSALTLKKEYLSPFLQTFPFGLPIHHRKIICFGCTPCTLKKLELSETYINRQAPPKVAFVLNWRDFSLGCHFKLHVTHIQKALPLPHLISKTETRKQTIASTVRFNSHSSLLFLSDMVDQAPALL